MFKHLVVLIALSAAVILGMSFAQQIVQHLLSAHDWVAQLLTDVFTEGQAGSLARGLIALLSIPVIVGLIPAVLYWLIRKSWFPYFMQIVWVVWLIQAGALLVMFKVAAAG